MFDDYKNSVLIDYYSKKKNNFLSLAMMEPTPAGIKGECLRILSGRYLKKDDKVLRDIFNITGELADYHRIIDTYDIDKFKPLCNFLKKKTINTDRKNIELLAWLVDFQERPYQWERTYEIGNGECSDQIEIATQVSIARKVDKVNSKREVQEEHADIDNVVPVVDKKTTSLSLWRRRKVELLCCSSIILLLFVGYMFWSTRTPQCMYWSGDHFEPVACDQKIPNVSIRALDKQMVSNFRKITKPDTITFHSIGKIWYSKYNAKVEFFTADGENPEPPNNELRRATKHMIEKYAMGIK